MSGVFHVYLFVCLSLCLRFRKLHVTREFDRCYTKDEPRIFVITLSTYAIEGCANFQEHALVYICSSFLAK